MALTGNKGEWSEIYLLLKLLGEGRVYAGDENMNKISDLYYPIIGIIRKEVAQYEYNPDIDCRVVVINEDGQKLFCIPMSRFLIMSELLLKKITSAETCTFAVPEIEDFMQEIKCSKLKASSNNKSDITIIIHDLRTGMKPRLGFSIKSKLGEPSTLLNAGKTTNFLYQITDVDLEDADIDEINKHSGLVQRMNVLKDMGCGLQYAGMDNKTFENNLLFADTKMPEMVAECIKEYYTNNVCRVREVVENVAKRHTGNFNPQNIVALYEYKIKTVLVFFALGMIPSKPWSGKYEANGGYLVVKEDGDIVCYHFYNRNDIEDYLYNNTRFDRPSRSRYQFGSVFRGNDGKAYIKLNLQIRFI